MSWIAIVAALAMAPAPAERFAAEHPSSHRIAAPEGPLTHASGFTADAGARTPEAAARAFLDRYGAAFGVHARETLVVSAASGSRVVRVLRLIDGLPVFDGDLALGVDAQNRVVVVNAAPVAAAVEGRRALTASDAEQAARTSLGPGLRAGPAKVAAGFLSIAAAVRPVYRVDLIATQPPGDFRTWIDAETGRVVFREDLRARATAPSKVFEISPVETMAALCPMSGAVHSACASLIAVTLPNLTTGAALEGAQTSVYNCKGADMPSAKKDVPGVCSPVDASSDAFDFPFDSSSTSLTDDFAAAMAYYHLDRHASFIKAIDPTVPPADSTSSGQSIALRGSLPALVNVKEGGKPMENAYYSGLLDAVVFGQGKATDNAYDATMIYHEFTHGVVDAWGGFGFGIDKLGGYDEGWALNEGTADAMTMSQTGKSQFGAYIASTYEPVGPELRDAADPDVRLTAQGSGTPVEHWGWSSANGADGESHDDGQVWSGLFWEVAGGLKAAGIRGCSGSCDAAAALQYRTVQLSTRTHPTFPSYAATLKSAATLLFPSQPAIATYVGCVAHRRQLDTWDRTSAIYAGEMRLQYVRTRFATFQLRLPVTGPTADVDFCSLHGSKTTIHVRDGAPVKLSRIDPQTGAATVEEDDSGTFARKCSEGATTFRFGPGNWFVLLESADAMVPDFDLFKVKVATTGAATRPAAPAPETCVLEGPLALQAATTTTPPLGMIQFSATGGAVPYVWSILTNGSGGAIDAASGAYKAGPKGSSTDVVQVKDGAGTARTTTVTVGPGVTVTPSAVTLKPGAAQAFTAAGGSATGFVWSLQANGSGATIGASDGAYTAGAKGGADLVLVTDSLGNTATAAVEVVSPDTGGCSTVGPMPLPLLALVFALRRRGAR